MATTYHTIVLMGRGMRKEAAAAAAITPGDLVEYTSSSKYRRHSTAGGNAVKVFAVENEVFGSEITVDYATNDNVLAEAVTPGMEVAATIAAGAAAITNGDFLESAGDGSLRKLISQQVPTENGLYTTSTLAVSATAEKFKTTATAYYKIGTLQYSKAATDNLTFSSAYTINTAVADGIKYGVFLIQINAAGIVSTKAPAADQSYTSAALALAALPSPDSGNVSLGNIVIGTKTGASWTANTDDMTAASDCSSVVVTDTSVVTVTPTALNTSNIIGQALETVDNSAGATKVHCKVVIL